MLSLEREKKKNTLRYEQYSVPRFSWNPDTRVTLNSHHVNAGLPHHPLKRRIQPGRRIQQHNRPREKESRTHFRLTHLYFLHKPVHTHTQCKYDGKIRQKNSQNHTELHNEANERLFVSCGVMLDTTEGKLHQWLWVSTYSKMQMTRPCHKAPNASSLLSVKPWCVESTWTTHALLESIHSHLQEHTWTLNYQRLLADQGLLIKQHCGKSKREAFAGTLQLRLHFWTENWFHSPVLHEHEASTMTV